MGGIGIWQLLIVAVIIVLLFGTKKLRNIGTDLGSAIKGFKSAVNDENKSDTKTDADTAKLANQEKASVAPETTKDKDQA